jgi:hypothetical protein
MEKITWGLYQGLCDLNVEKLRHSCYNVLNDIKDLPLNSNYYDLDNQKDAPNSTKSVNQYNFLTFVYPEIHKLYHTIRNQFFVAEKLHYGINIKTNYYIQSWLNVYKKDQFINWHSHNYDVARAWHGFFCVYAEPSKTIYKINDLTIDVPSINNNLVIGLCENNSHRTEPWHDSNFDRVTIAFDIIPEIALKGHKGNHWIPI